MVRRPIPLCGHLIAIQLISVALFAVEKRLDLATFDLSSLSLSLSLSRLLCFSFSLPLFSSPSLFNSHFVASPCVTSRPPVLPMHVHRITPGKLLYRRRCREFKRRICSRRDAESNPSGRRDEGTEGNAIRVHGRLNSRYGRQ